jgi:hypothetical protein
MSTPRTKVKNCIICNKEFTANWQHKMNAFSIICSPKCSAVLRNRPKADAAAPLVLPDL